MCCVARWHVVRDDANGASFSHARPDLIAVNTLSALQKPRKQSWWRSRCFSCLSIEGGAPGSEAARAGEPETALIAPITNPRSDRTHRITSAMPSAQQQHKRKRDDEGDKPAKRSDVAFISNLIETNPQLRDGFRADIVKVYSICNRLQKALDAGMIDGGQEDSQAFETLLEAGKGECASVSMCMVRA